MSIGPRTPRDHVQLRSGKIDAAKPARREPLRILGPDPDDSWQFACEQIPPAGLNLYFWCNRRADAALHDALRTFDRARRTRDYAVVQSEIRSDLPELTLWQVRMPDAYRGTLRNFSPSPLGSTFWNAWRWSL